MEIHQFWTNPNWAQKETGRGERVQHRQETHCECTPLTHSPWGENPMSVSQKAILTKGSENIQHSNKETEHSKSTAPTQGANSITKEKTQQRQPTGTRRECSAPYLFLAPSSWAAAQIRIRFFALEHHCPSSQCLLILTLQQNCPIIQEHTWREHFKRGSWKYELEGRLVATILDGPTHSCLTKSIKFTAMGRKV